MRSVLWKTFGLSAPILMGLLGFSSPSEKLVGGRVDAVVCGDVVSLFCEQSIVMIDDRDVDQATF